MTMNIFFLPFWIFYFLLKKKKNLHCKKRIKNGAFLNFFFFSMYKIYIQCRLKNSGCCLWLQ